MAKGRAKFEGDEVVGVTISVMGKAGDDRLNAPLKLGDRVVVVSEGVVDRVAHQRSDVGLVRVQTVKVAEGFVLADETDALDLIHKLRRDRQKELDDLLGTPPLEGFDEGGAT